MLGNLGSFTFNLRKFIIDEIALEGLEGIIIDTLWKRMEVRTSSTFSEKMKEKWWNFIINSEIISAYKLPEPAPRMEIADRFSMVNEANGYILEPDFYFDGEYEYHPVDDDYGSCKHYNTRVLISEEIKHMPYKTVVDTYGDYLVLVAAKEERWKALAPHIALSDVAQIPLVSYCLLELIGKARENGQTTTGRTNLIKMVKDSKIMFYYRKYLQDLDLIRVTYITHVSSGKTVKVLLLRLKRFNKSVIQTMPKSGMLRNLVDHLMDKANYCAVAEDIIKKGLMTPVDFKKYQKKTNLFYFEDRLVQVGQPSNPQAKIKTQRKRHMCLMASSDESSDSEDEVAPVKCQYKIGVNLLRQAYERFLDAGKSGLTQNELAQLVGVEFYVCRTICKVFKKKNIVREFFEYKGKQRIGRFIAIAATSKMYNTLAEEEKKFEKYVKEGKNTTLKRKASSDSEPLSQMKKRKLDIDVKPDDEMFENITEVHQIIPSFERKHRANLKLSLRHLKFASGIVKVLNERTYVIGFTTLSNIVAKEINEFPMDIKAIKQFLQNMINEGHVKIFKVRLPRFHNRYSIIICAPHVNITDPIIREKYHEIEERARTNSEITKKKMIVEKPMAEYAYPRYVKVQKLHESLMKIVYFSDVKTEPPFNKNQLPLGFIAMKRLILELPIGVALGHISSEGVLDIAKFTIEDSMHDIKVGDGPPDLQRALASSANLNKSLRTSLKILATFGLVQFVAEVSKLEATRIADNNLVVNLFYLNRVAKIIDTSGNWPRLDKGADAEEKVFHFESFEVVREFWKSIYNISMTTTIGLTNRKKKVMIKTPIRTKDQPVLFDTGIRYGDGLGPCGYDSSYFMDIQRLWRAYVARSTTRLVKEIKKLQAPPKLEIPKKAKVKRRKTKKVKAQKPKPVEKTKIGRITRKKVTGVVWTKTEDRFLMMCKAAITVVSPISQPGSLQIRNLVAKDILSINDPKKTLRCCHSRTAALDSNSTLTHERNWLLNEARRHPQLLLKYEGTLKKLRTMYPANMSKCIYEARVPMMELVWIFHQLLKNMVQKQDKQCMDLDEFHRTFTIVPSSASQRGDSYSTPHSDIITSTLKESIMLTVVLNYNNKISKDYGDIVYCYFNRYSEEQLRSAIEQLRKCAAIAVKEKVLSNQMSIVDMDNSSQCAFRISAYHQRRWASRLSSEFADKLVDWLNKTENDETIKADSDTNCFCFELNSIGALELVPITVPVITGPSGSIMQDEYLSVIDIETNFKLKSGKLRWKNTSSCSKIGNIYKDIPIEIALETLSRKYFIPEKDTSKESKDEKLIAYLVQKGENGATFEELQESFKCDTQELIKIITELEAKNQIRRVGFWENVVVYVEFAKYWTMKVKKGSIIPVPWLTLESKVRSDVFIQWAGVILNKAFECPGCTISFLSEQSEFLTTRAAQDICEVLQKCECVTLHSLKLKEASLFSDEDDVVTKMTDYNEYESPKNIVVLPVSDCMSKFSYIRNMLLNNT